MLTKWGRLCKTLLNMVMIVFFYSGLSPIRHQAITQVNTYYLLDKKPY